jgi:hypothetical protein
MARTASSPVMDGFGIRGRSGWRFGVLEMRSGNLLLRRTLDGEMWKVVTADLVAVCLWTSSMKEVKACYEKVKETLVGWEPKEGIETPASIRSNHLAYLSSSNDLKQPNFN